MLARARANALGERLGTRLVACRHEHGELLAPEPRGDVDLPRLAGQNPRHVDEHAIADHVPPLVVDRLEVVDVERGQGDRCPSRRA